jgi:hypothetical protein
VCGLLDQGDGQRDPGEADAYTFMVISTLLCFHFLTSLLQRGKNILIDSVSFFNELDMGKELFS